MAKGGKREGAGRKKNSPNKATIARQARVQATGITPIDFMLKMMRDEDQPLNIRCDMAKAVAPYVHPKLATIEHKGDADNPINISVGFRWMTEAEARGRGWA